MTEENELISDNNQEENDPQEKQPASKEGKNLFGILGETVSIFFTKDLNKFQAILTDPKPNNLQRMAVIKDIELKKIRDLHITLIEIIKGMHDATTDLRVAAARALERAGGVYSLEISSALILDILEIYMTTLEPKLYSNLHRVFLGMESFPYNKYASKLLINRFMLAGDVNSMVWEVYSRILHLCFDFLYQEEEPALKAELKKIGSGMDKSRSKVEQAVYYARRVIEIATQAKNDLCVLLEKNPDGAKIAQVMQYLSLLINYHEKCHINTLLEPVINAILDERPPIRAFVLEELESIRTPIAYEFYRSLILKTDNPYLDVSRQLISLLANLSLTDLSALEIFISFLSKLPSNDADIYFDELERICKLDSSIFSKVNSIAIELINEGECPDDSVQMIIMKIFPIKITRVSLELIINMSLGRIRISVASGAKAARILTRLNTPSFEYFEDVINTLDVILTHSAPREIKESIFKEIKIMPTVHNLAALSKSVFDVDREISKIALLTYLDIVKTGKVDHPVFVAFVMKFFNAEVNSPELTVTLLDFLKVYNRRDSEIAIYVLKLVYSEQQEVRSAALALCHMWFLSSTEQSDRKNYLDSFLNILSDTTYKWADTYKKIAVLIAEYVCSQERDVIMYAENILQRLKNILETPLEEAFSNEICRALEFIAENAVLKIKLQAEWLMDLILKNPNISEYVSLYILKIMVLKLGLLFQYTRTIAKMLQKGSSEYKINILEVLLSGISKLSKTTYAERLAALKINSPKELVEYCNWDAQFNREILPILLTTLRNDLTNVPLLKMSFLVIKRMEYARKFSNFLFEFRNYPHDPIICQQAIDAVASLLYPDFSPGEQNILYGMSKVALDASQPSAVRINAILGLAQISDVSQYQTLVSILINPAETEEIRAIAVRAMNIFGSPAANDVYIPLLSDSSIPVKMKELMIDGLAVFGDSRMLEPLIAIMKTPPTPKLKELVKSVMLEKGYGELAEVQGIYEKLQELDKQRKDMTAEIKEAEEELEQLPVKMKMTEERLLTINNNLSTQEGRISDVQNKIKESDDQWEAVKFKITAGIREIAPNWPADTKVAPECKQLFVQYQESLREEKDRYETVREDNHKKLHSLLSDKDYMITSRAEAEAKIKEFKEMIASLSNKIKECNNRLPALVRQLDLLLKEASKRQDAFRIALPQIDEENQQKLIHLYDKREEDWNSRHYYYKFIEKSMPEKM